MDGNILFLPGWLPPGIPRLTASEVVGLNVFKDLLFIIFQEGGLESM